MVASIDITGGDHGTDVGVRSTDSGGEGIAIPCLHLHHHGGLPGTLHLPPLCRDCIVVYAITIIVIM